MTVRVEHIGAATLYLGDARDVLPTLADASIDFIFTDPPYGHNNNNNDLIRRWEAALGRLPSNADIPLGRPITNDGGEADPLVRWFYGEANRLLGRGCCCCCCGGGGGPDPQFARWSLWMDEAIGFKQMVVWDKGPMGMGWHYRRSYETVLVGEKRGGACRWFDATGAVENVIRPGKIRKIIPTADQHPTPKDPNLALHFIRLHTEPSHLVLDPFMGAGSTMTAAINAGRRFVGVEIDERWFDVAHAEAQRLLGLHALFEPAARPVQMNLCLTPEEDAADSLLSYNAAVMAIGERVKAGAPVPEFMLSRKAPP